MVKEICRRIKASFLKVCETLKLSYSSVMRWKRRAEKDEPVIGKSGPKKVCPPDMSVVMEQIKGLKHCKKRTRGTGALYHIHKESLARREVANLVNKVRTEVIRGRGERRRRIRWHVPGLTWAIDGAELPSMGSQGKVYFHLARDLASQFKFNPLSGRRFALGIEIAGYLRGLFEEYGPPLILKRDNHGVLNAEKVNDVLEDYMVIPLNSPGYYPMYNGAVEHDQGEFKREIAGEMAGGLWSPRDNIAARLKNAVNDLNHRPRRNLGGRNSCRVFFERKGDVRFDKRQRYEIMVWLTECTSLIINELEDESDRAKKAAWRAAVEYWLSINRYITVSINRKVLPYFSPIFSHN